MTWDSFIDKILSLQVLLAIISSTVISAIVSSLFTKLISDKNLSLEYITKERRAWREQIKEKVSIIVSDPRLNQEELMKIVTSLQLSLNPNDPNDQEIIKCLDKILINPSDLYQKGLLRKMTAQLLKHDWDRAKREASPWKWFKKRPKRKLK
jgi:hypothetical protein